jgi:hypothetical protein
MVIGINGKINSGKDTIGSIIQYLTSECGDPESSKHRTYKEFIQKGGGFNLRNFDQHYVSDWEIKKFAGKLKAVASILTGIPIYDFENQEFKKKLMGLQWEMTYREFLQKLGTEVMRDNLHTNVWINALFADYRETESIFRGKVIEKHSLPNWIITDMRFPNEMEAVEEKEGITIRVVRYPDIKLQHSGKKDDFTSEKFDITNPKHARLLEGESSRLHPSETALDDAKFDYEIINDAGIIELIEKVKQILIEQKII